MWIKKGTQLETTWPILTSNEIKRALVLKILQTKIHKIRFMRLEINLMTTHRQTDTHTISFSLSLSKKISRFTRSSNDIA